jgi:ABC-2 type transport system permease protein
MIFLCGLFFPISALPKFLRPLPYLFPLTYEVDILHGAIHNQSMFPMSLNFMIIAGFCLFFFFVSIRNVNSRWII